MDTKILKRECTIGNSKVIVVETVQTTMTLQEAKEKIEQVEKGLQSTKQIMNKVIEEHDNAVILKNDLEKVITKLQLSE